MGRRKRIKKSIKSLEKRVTEHRKKIKMAKNKFDAELVGYYQKEIEKFAEEIRKKKKKLKK